MKLKEKPKQYPSIPKGSCSFYVWCFTKGEEEYNICKCCCGLKSKRTTDTYPDLLPFGASVTNICYELLKTESPKFHDIQIISAQIDSRTKTGQSKASLVSPKTLQSFSTYVYQVFSRSVRQLVFYLGKRSAVSRRAQD